MDKSIILELKEEIKHIIENFFADKIFEAISQEKRRVVLDFFEIERINLKIAENIIRNPEFTISLFERAINEIKPPSPKELEEGRITRLNVRFINLPESTKINIRDIRSSHLNRMITIEGVVKAASDVRPIAVAVKYICERCGWESDWMRVDLLKKPRDRIVCPNCKRASQVKIFRKKLIDAQRLLVEEIPENVEGQPKSINVLLLDDLVDPEMQKYTIPGKRVRISGILKEVPMKGKQMYDFIIVANWIESLEKEFEEMKLSEEDIKKIIELSKDPEIDKKIIRSIAPSIAGYEKVKEAIALQLFGGVKKKRPDGTTTRGDIHILLIGDPGTGKCVLYDTEIYVNGKKIKIGKFYEKLESNERIRGDTWYKFLNFDAFTKSFNEKMRLKNDKIIAVTKRKYSGTIYTILVGDREISVTEEHPIFVLRENTFVPIPARELEVGDIILINEKSIIDGIPRNYKIESIRKIKKKKYEDIWVYDLQTKEFHNFLANDILIHNSQILKHVAVLAPKGMYVSGKGVTGPGITATVVRDEVLGGWVLEAGPLVLMSGGTLCIDELDKVKKEDIAALHEALEQQTISIAKANIHATLKAETTVLAAANPKFGRFDPYRPIPEQIDLPPTIINRFDLIFPFKDIPDLEKDKIIVEHVLREHISPEEISPEIPVELLRKYIAYARQNVFPKFTREAAERIKEFYLKLRSKVQSLGEGIRPIPISARQLEALIRLAEASARMHLRERVTVEDAERAISLMKYYLKEVGLDPETGVIDIDRVMTGIPARKRDKISRVFDIIQTLSKEFPEGVPIEEILAEAEKEGIKQDEVRKIIEDLKRKGDIFEPSPGKIATI